MAWSWYSIFEPTPPGPFPTFIDVGCPRNNPSPFSGTSLFVYWVGGDGSLWRCQALPAEGWQQIPAPGTVTRVAVTPDGTVWCVTADKAAYYSPNGDGTWTKVGLLANAHPVDVDAAREGSVWILMTSGEYWAQRADGQSWYFSALPLAGVAAFDQPVSLSDSGGAWGIFGSSGKSGSICWCNHIWEAQPPWGGTFIGDVVDVSTSPNYLWMVKSDGSVWTTQNGTTQTRIGETFLAQRICGGYFPESETPGGERAFAVAKNGTAWTYAASA
jgi:hypothetical protein